MEKENKKVDVVMSGFFPVSTTRIDWKSRKRSASGSNIEKGIESNANTSTLTPTKPEFSERRKALFEPLEPLGNISVRRTSIELLLPPPDFDSATYPKGWLIGKKRKLVNVDVVESMRRIAIQEMNRKDREIDGLNEQLEEDSCCLQHLQLQLLQERSKRTEVGRQNALLQEQASMLMNMLQEQETLEDESTDQA